MTHIYIQDTKIDLSITDQNQELIIQNTILGANLAKLFGSVDMVDDQFVVHHTDAVDQLIRELIDALITVRYEHPQLLQIQVGSKK